MDKVLIGNKSDLVQRRTIPVELPEEASVYVNVLVHLCSYTLCISTIYSIIQCYQDVVISLEVVRACNSCTNLCRGYNSYMATKLCFLSLNHILYCRRGNFCGDEISVTT